ncbi:preprotein translocase subunit SecE [Patescibacteria group bacterium]
MKAINYIKDVKGELKHVAWPTRRQIILFTTVVIIISVATAYFLGAFDFLFTKALNVFVI